MVRVWCVLVLLCACGETHTPCNVATLELDRNNCGACGRACPNGEVCSAAT